MPDSPDYGKYLPGSVRFSLQDLSELAARLGSPDVVDRRGEVLWLDAFDSGFGPWTTFISGVNALAQIIASDTYQYPYAAHLRTNNVLNNTAYLSKTFGLFVTGRIGVEFFLAVTLSQPNIELYASLSDGLVSMEPRIRINCLTKNLYVTDEASVEQVVGSVPTVAFATPNYLPIKLVFDIITKRYVRAIVVNTEFDLSGYLFPLGGLTSTSSITISLSVKTQLATSADLYVAHSIVTGNEP